MDEIVIGEKRYVSSKKAAKITGYAKDYVGQLCREGKVEARLVGRNWYVLESSILAHRFGDEVDETQKEMAPVRDLSTNSEKNVATYSWNAPTYTTEQVEMLPEIPAKPAVTRSEEADRAQDMPVVDMQHAWQEWFSKKKEEELLPSGADMVLSDGGDEEKYEQKQDFFETTVPEEVEQQVQIHKVAAPVLKESPRSQAVYEPDPVFIEKKPIMRAISDERTGFYSTFPQKTPAQGRKTRKNTPPRAGTKRNVSYTIVRIALVAVFGLVVAATYAAVSSIKQSELGGSNAIINFLNGVSTIQ